MIFILSPATLWRVAEFGKLLSYLSIYYLSSIIFNRFKQF